MRAQSAGLLMTGRGRPTRVSRRMDPNGVYYLVIGVAATLAGIAVDLASGFPWWALTVLGLVGAWGFTWLTALDDVRHPWRSLRIVAAGAKDPRSTVGFRARVYEMPLYAPPPERDGVRRLSGGGCQFGPGLLSPAKPSARVSWESGPATMRVTTVTTDVNESEVRRFPVGIAAELIQVEDDPALDGVATEELMAQLTTVAMEVEGKPLSGSVLDLTPWGLGWIATLRPDRRCRLDIAATGIEPTSVTLVRFGVDELERPKRG